MMYELWEVLYLCLYLLTFFLCICHDLWKKSVPNVLLLLSFLLGVPFFISRVWSSTSGLPWWHTLTWAALSFVPGSIMLIFSRLTGEILGMGDGYFFLMSGCFLPPRSIFILLIIGIFTSGVTGILILSIGKVRKLNWKNCSIPFLPCLLPALPVVLSSFPV